MESLQSVNSVFVAWQEMEFYYYELYTILHFLKYENVLFFNKNKI